MLNTPYAPYLLCGLFVLAIFVWEWFNLYLRPLFVPKAEIMKLADDLARAHGADADYYAFIEEDRALRYTDTYQAGVWRRVRKMLKSRMRVDRS